MRFCAAIYYVCMTYAIKKMHRIQSIRDAALIAEKVLILSRRHLKTTIKNIYYFSNKHSYISRVVSKKMKK